MSGVFIRHCYFYAIMKIKLLFILAWITTVCGAVSAQEIVQLVKGTVTDQTNHTLAGASVKVSNPNVSLGTTSNESGYFELSSIPVGRYIVYVSFTGYRPWSSELLVIAGRESVVAIRLYESSTILENIDITADKNAIDEIPGLKSTTIEKTMRVPANFFDPVRMVTSYPGIVAANDQGNSIIIKGNSPNGLLWRLNGLDIVNPNHLANAGTLSDKPVANGGGVNILSAQMLDRTDFYTGYFPASYGNTSSGAIDMKLRSGNGDHTEFTAQASVIGLDASAEGPIGKNTSFLANYRYSTVGLLSKLGIDFGGEVIDFQDFSFSLNSAGKTGSTLSVFGFGGLSKNDFSEKEQAEWEEDKDHTNVHYTGKTFALGLNYMIPVKRGSFSVAIGYSGTDQYRRMATSVFLLTPSIVGQNYEYQRSLLSSNIRYKVRLGPRIGWELGSTTNYSQDDLLSYDKISLGVYEKMVDANPKGFLIQPYTNFDIALAKSIDVNVGVRYFNYTYNQTQSLEPRFMLSYRPDLKKSFSLSYALVSQTQMPALYAGNNKKLELTKVHQVAAAYHQQIKPSFNLTAELYYQHLYDVPVEILSSGFSAINLLEGYTPGDLASDGTGENYGVQATIEKSFYNAVYFMIGGSYYESMYKASDNKTRDSRFNGKYTGNATLGKEWRSKRKNRTTGVHMRGLYLGGLRETPIDVFASQNSYETVYDNTRPFYDQLRDYFRVDLRLSFRKNKAHYTRTFAIDLQNVTSQQNEAYHYYDFTKAKVVTKYQLGLIPVLVYRIDF